MGSSSIDLLYPLLTKSEDETEFIQNGVSFGRGHSVICTDIEKCDHQIVCWRTYDDHLVSLNPEENGSFYDEETYLIKWKVCQKYHSKDDVYFYWKGNKAQKGKSPLPPGIKDETPVERICHWSEPTVFLRLFAGKMIVHSGKKGQTGTFPRLYILCGEFNEEMRLYEVPCQVKSLRSKTCFLLVDTDKDNINLTVWHGSKSLETQKKYIFKIACSTFSHNTADIEIVEEGMETKYFLDLIQGDIKDYFNFRDVTLTEKTPRLFYFHKLTGSLDFIEIENIYRSKVCITQFPFLQSHLYSAIEPALFLLDATYKVWVWESSVVGEQEEIDDEFASDLKTVKCLAVEYSNKMGYVSSVEVVPAREEPCEFTNVFPYWEK